MAAALLVVAACSTASPSSIPRSATDVAAAGTQEPVATVSPTGAATDDPSLAPTASPTQQTSPPPVTVPPASLPPFNTSVYSATIGGTIPAKWAAMPERVYVPDEKSHNIVVIDPATFTIVGKFDVGSYPEHITPGWDGKTLYVENMSSDSLTEIDPMTAQPNGVTIKVPNPYNLYFTPDGRYAIIVEDRLHGWPTEPNGLLFLDRTTWKTVGFVGIPWAGANHMDFTADGKVLLISTEFGGRIVAVDVAKRKIIKSFNVGGSPTDVRLSPDGRVIYVANQRRDGVDVIDALSLTYLKFIRCGDGAHGLGMSRDATRLFVTNRYAGTMSVIDLATRTVVHTWTLGGSPDMIAVSPDGSQLWISNRFSSSIVVVDSSNGHVIKTIETGIAPHGLSYWPEPGRYSLGHNGNMR
jgi:YVTN family beta-propeller protein